MVAIYICLFCNLIFSTNALRMKQTWLGILLLVVLACKNQQVNQPPVATFQSISGQTMGTYYKVSYQHPTAKPLQPDIETLLKEINLGVNTYDKNASISQFNQSTIAWRLDTSAYGKHFFRNLVAAKAIHQATDGNFDPTVMPLVNYWGFGYTPKQAVTKVDSFKVDSLRQLVGFNKITIDSTKKMPILRKEQIAAQIDFSALAKGYGVDEVALLLEKEGVQNYLVDIGGEARAKGVNKRNVTWRLGINTPNTNAAITDYVAIIALNNRSMATSGNYRNFYEVDGKKYAHTLNPKTGYPELNNLLSTTVLAKDCMVADGFATAFMTMGLEQAYQTAATLPGIEAYFLYAQNDGTVGVKYTDGVKDFLIE